MMTRRALARQEQSKLQLALKELKASKELCTQLNSERDENEKELLDVLRNNNRLKSELSDLHIKHAGFLTMFFFTVEASDILIAKNAHNLEKLVRAWIELTPSKVKSKSYPLGYHRFYNFLREVKAFDNEDVGILLRNSGCWFSERGIKVLLASTCGYCGFSLLLMRWASADVAKIGALSPTSRMTRGIPTRGSAYTTLSRYAKKRAMLEVYLHDQNENEEIRRTTRVTDIAVVAMRGAPCSEIRSKRPKTGDSGTPYKIPMFSSGL
ncbi:jg9130 [Pararge aegeria aegeria]|uniref:Jg9130 protein n=1 Tax=Pararge aegeria aegeria TaxID=348720 RepID=A0A8S4QMU7_9NEOP|nr:jg9130 [Pararge aegeria aegeria]